MGSALTGRLQPPSAAATPVAAAPAAATPAAFASPSAATSAIIEMSSEESKDYASDLLTPPAMAAAVLIPCSTTSTQMNVAAIFGQKIYPVWAYFSKLSPEVPSGPNQ